MKRLALLLLILCAPAAHALDAQSFAAARGEVPPALSGAEVQAGFCQQVLANWADPAIAAPLITNLMENDPYELYVLFYLFESQATTAQVVAFDDEIAAAVGAMGLYTFELVASDQQFYNGAYSKMMARAKAYPSPSIWMTLEDIYLEFATATSTTISSGAAAAYTGAYALWELGGSFWGGYWAGTLINNLIEEYDPSYDADVAQAVVDQLNLMQLEAELQFLALVDLYNWLTLTLGTPYPLLVP
jgi:hypothetical protein